MAGLTVFNCSNCNKELLFGSRQYCEKTNTTECPECVFHTLNGTRTIKKYNAWLKGEKKNAK